MEKDELLELIAETRRTHGELSNSKVKSTRQHRLANHFDWPTDMVPGETEWSI